MKSIFNQPNLLSRRRHLRRSLTPAESILWSRLRNRQLLGLKIRRQYSVGSFILDFYIPELNLAIELDGDTHASDSAQQYDSTRQRSIEDHGITFMRFTNTEVSENLNGLLEVIAQKAEELKQKNLP